MTEILGYTITQSQEALEIFIAQAHQEYEALDRTIVPVDEKIKELQKDWHPRPSRFWHQILYTHIPAIREATAAVFLLFDRKQSKITPLPIIISGMSIGYIFDLNQINSEIEEVGILLTAYLSTPTSSSVEHQIRERQRFMRALQKLSGAVHDAKAKGCARLKEATKEQVRLLARAEPQDNPSAKKQPALRVVTDNGEETQV